VEVPVAVEQTPQQSEEVGSSVSEIDQQEADALGVNLGSFGDAFTAEELMSGESGVVLSDSEATGE